VASPTPVTLVPDEVGLVTPLPPQQPAEGPHGFDYAFPGRPARIGVSGLGGFTVYEPRDEAGEAPAFPVPVVLLLRGACVGACSMTMTNNIMNAWRDHLAKKGNIVVFPHYQQRDEPELELANVAGALHMALRVLGEPGFVAAHPELAWESDEGAGRAQPDLGRFGIAGHSRGSQMTVKLAARIFNRGTFAAGTLIEGGATAATLGLPRPDWLLVVEPGPTSFSDFGDLAALPAAVRLVVVVGEDDTLAGEDKARVIWSSATRIPAVHRDYVRVRSHRRGPWSFAALPADGCDTPGETIALASCASTNMAWTFTPRQVQAARNVVNPAAQSGDLVADHFFPGAGSALDVYALWKISQGLVECTGADGADGGCAIDRDMGTWSDGVQVYPLCVTDDPAEDWSASCGN
jgi:hypothetical protein